MALVRNLPYMFSPSEFSSPLKSISFHEIEERLTLLWSYAGCVYRHYTGRLFPKVFASGSNDRELKVFHFFGWNGWGCWDAVWLPKAGTHSVLAENFASVQYTSVFYPNKLLSYGWLVFPWHVWYRKAIGNFLVSFFVLNCTDSKMSTSLTL